MQMCEEGKVEIGCSRDEIQIRHKLLSRCIFTSLHTTLLTVCPGRYISCRIILVS